MARLMRRFLLFFASLAVLLPGSGWAEDLGEGFPSPEPVQPGMRHIRVTREPAEKAKALSPPENKPSAEKSVQADPLSKAQKKGVLPLEKALVKPENLKTWPYLSKAALAHSSEDVQKIVALIEEDPGAVPPQGLFLAAKALADQQKMEDASLYYFVAQLRLMFDTIRWPPRARGEDQEAFVRDSRKNDDQKNPSVGSAPRVNNPHAFLSDLADEIGAPIVKWSLANPDRMDKILGEVQKWDESTPYLYLPGYELGQPLAFEEWGHALSDVRMLYFQKMNSVSKGLRALKTP